MRKIIALSTLIGITCSVFVGGCSPFAKPAPHDYEAYLSKMPSSILVLPAINESMEAMAPYIHLSMVSYPLAEAGYYVFPVAVVDALMKENGVASPEDMHGLSLKKIEEIIAPDAVLYLHIKEWSTEYKVISSITTVHIAASLVDTKTGTELWIGEKMLSRSSSDSSDGPIEALISALVSQVLNTVADKASDVAKTTTAILLRNARAGLLLGKYHPKFEEDQKKRRGGEEPS